MKDNASDRDILTLANEITKKGLEVYVSKETRPKIIGIIGDRSKISDLDIEHARGVYKYIDISNTYKLASREACPDGRTVYVKDQQIGKDKLLMIAGPCTVESEAQLEKVAMAVKNSKATFLRGGAYKPRTSPYSFQGLKNEGYKLLRKVADSFGLKVVSEVVSESFIDDACKYCDMLQIGARNMQNFILLKEVGRSKMPVLLKRGISSTIQEWLDAAEYIMSEGNYNVVLCERGIRTFENSTRNTLDISAVPVIKQKSCLPIIVDPSHACGNSSYIKSLSLASVAAGADGLMIEVHPDPKSACSDVYQQVTPAVYDDILSDVLKIANVLGKTL